VVAFGLRLLASHYLAASAAGVSRSAGGCITSCGGVPPALAWQCITLAASAAGVRLVVAFRLRLLAVHYFCGFRLGRASEFLPPCNG